jgi:hypothetical protein
MKELELVKSNRFIFYVASLTVLFLAPNTYYVYYTLSVFTQPYREIASAGVALIVASSIMIYTVRKNFTMAIRLAWFEVMIAEYYYTSTIGFDWALIPGTGFAIILPITLSMYTKELEVDVSGRELIDFMDKNPKSTPADFFKSQKGK